MRNGAARGTARSESSSSIELCTTALAAAGTSTTLEGSSCALERRTVEVKGQRVALEAADRVAVGTPGQVNIRGEQRITLN